MQIYLDLLRRILDEGVRREDRTGTGTVSVFGHQMVFDLREGFPLVTTKKIYTRSVFGELLWFLRGDTNVGWLHDNNIHIWDEWADENGDLGPVYGHQWRSWPDGGGTIDQMALPPCHTLFQFYVTPDDRGTPTWLSCQLYQRSGDTFLGVPFNIASYALLTHLVASVTGLKPLRFVHTLGDAHVYLNHLDQVHEQLKRKPRHRPTLTVNPNVRDIDGFELSDITLTGYDPYPALPAPIAV